MATTHLPVTENTLISIKVAVNDSTRKLKLPLGDLGAEKLIPKLRRLLAIDPSQSVVFERYSDSVGDYVILDPTNPAVFKTLVRAAKAKLKLRLRASATLPPSATVEKDSISDTTPSLEALVSGTSLPVRGSTAFDQRSVGPGIFQFREPVMAEKKSEKSGSDDAPVPRAFTTTNKDFFAKLATHGLEHDLALRAKASPFNPAWSVYCNQCDAAMNNVHYHCSVCDGGDYDLCQSCVDSGKLCLGEDHWLIKRTITDGKIVASVTERVAPKARGQPAVSPRVEDGQTEKTLTDREMPGAFTDDARTLSDEPEGSFRTCNNCIIGLPDHEFVTCGQCDDFDLCLRCYAGNKHGHHPAHHFEPAASSTKLSATEEALLAPGRDVPHNAICDGCDKNIRGVRHKCFTCPDFDYCNDCVKRARVTHPRHHFAKVYEPAALAQGITAVIHHGIYCDGPLCKDQPSQSYIRGVRYKCVVCHDTDFCASCEALPANYHNKTHPLIKFKTAVNHVTISTENEDRNGHVKKLGDVVPSTPASPAQSTNVTTSVKTVADIKPSPKAVEETKPETPTTPAFVDLPAPRKLQDASQTPENAPLEAHFVRDSVVDGTTMAPNTRFTQVWTLRNPGSRAWPAGCSVRFIGGDNMLNIDNTRPSSMTDVNEATESNVIGREVQPGEEVAFKVLMKSPMREGKSISYWRVKAADGTPFGHKLWCDIDVKKADPAAPANSASDTPVSEQPLDQTKMAEYWAGYQQRMAAIRLANAQRQAAMQRPRVPAPSDVLQAKLDMAATYQAQVDWRKQMEEFVRRTNSSNMLQPAASDDGSKADMSVKAELATPKIESTLPKVAAQEAVDDEDAEKDAKDSQMIFPTLERESPSSSTYESLGSSGAAMAKPVTVEDDPTDTKVADASQILPPTTTFLDTEEQFEDISELDVLSADGDDESDSDGFMTDEEYDILDASDQETVASK